MMENQAVQQAVVVNQGGMKSNQGVTRIALFTSGGAPIDLGTAGGSVLLTELEGLTTGAVEAIDENDTILTAFAKLQAQISALS